MKRFIPVLIVIALSMFAIRALLVPGYFPMHDDTQVSRVIAMGRALREGQFPVRWVADLGYGNGYPIFNFYGPLPYYVGGSLYALGVPALISTKLMFAIGVILPAITLYVVLAGVVGWQAGLISSLLYLYAPYHAVQIYVRGAVGEYWTLIFWPLILYAFMRTEKRDDVTRRIGVGVVGIVGAILSHTLLGYVTVLFLVIGLGASEIYQFFSHHLKKSTVASYWWTIFLGLGVSAFFWLPAIWEMSYTNVSGQVSQTANYPDHFVCLGQLWSSLWGFGGSAPGCIDGMSFIVGKIHIVITTLAVIGWMRVRNKQYLGLFVFGVLLALFGIFLTTAYSTFVWALVPGFSYLQYPWRFLSLASFGVAIVGGMGVLGVSRDRRMTMVAGAAAIVIIAMNAKWFVPQYTYQKTSEDFERVSDLRWRASNISDEYLPSDFVRPRDDAEVVFDTIVSGDGLTANKLRQTAVEEHWIVEATAFTQVVLHKTYFPGWRYFVNATEVVPNVSSAVARIPVSEGQSVIVMKFTDTMPRKIGNGISVLSLLLVGGVFYGKQKKAKR